MDFGSSTPPSNTAKTGDSENDVPLSSFRASPFVLLRSLRLKDTDDYLSVGAGGTFVLSSEPTFFKLRVYCSSCLPSLEEFLQAEPNKFSESYYNFLKRVYQFDDEGGGVIKSVLQSSDSYLMTHSQCHAAFQRVMKARSKYLSELSKSGSRIASVPAPTKYPEPLDLAIIDEYFLAFQGLASIYKMTLSSNTDQHVRLTSIYANSFLYGDGSKNVYLKVKPTALRWANAANGGNDGMVASAVKSFINKMVGKKDEFHKNATDGNHVIHVNHDLTFIEPCQFELLDQTNEIENAGAPATLHILIDADTFYPRMPLQGDMWSEAYGEVKMTKSTMENEPIEEPGPPLHEFVFDD